MTTDKALDWDETIEADETGTGGEWKPLPEGEYAFTVSKMEKARYAGSAKLPACNQVKLELRCENADGAGTVRCNLFLVQSQGWKLLQFFTAIGQRKHGDGAFSPNWSRVTGSEGMCRLSVRTYDKRDGTKGESNEVDRWLDPSASTDDGDAPLPF